MPTNEQKRIWKQEKEQMLRDKQRQGREVRHRKVDLKLGSSKNKAPLKQEPALPADTPPDDILRKRLGI